MRGVWSTLALVVAAAGLGAYIYFVESERPETEAKAKVFAVEADDDRGNPRHRQGRDVAAAQDRRHLEAGRADRHRGRPERGLGPGQRHRQPRGEPRGRAQRRQPGRVRSGRTEGRPLVQGGGRRHRPGAARRSDPDRRATCTRSRTTGRASSSSPTFSENTLARSSFDLRDKRVLRFERDKADGLEITNAKGTAAMSRSRLRPGASPRRSNARGDYGAIEGVLTKLVDHEHDGGRRPRDEGSRRCTASTSRSRRWWSRPAAAPRRWRSGKTEAGKTFARDLSRGLVFTVDESMATDMQKGADDYRRKEVFDFRGFTRQGSRGDARGADRHPDQGPRQRRERRREVAGGGQRRRRVRRPRRRRRQGRGSADQDLRAAGGELRRQGARGRDARRSRWRRGSTRTPARRPASRGRARRWWRRGPTKPASPCSRPRPSTRP